MMQLIPLLIYTVDWWCLEISFFFFIMEFY
jgi:hypothetical protein